MENIFRLNGNNFASKWIFCASRMKKHAYNYAAKNAAKLIKKFECKNLPLQRTAISFCFAFLVVHILSAALGMAIR
jgi:hypothetical protein